jgi:hypothetical protein
MSVLPKEINYKSAISLPEGTQSNSIVASPINGQTFGPSSIIQFDLVQRGYLVPESMYIRFRLVTTLPTTTAAAAGAVKGTPVYTPFARLETIVGSQVVESIQNYNQLCNMLVNCKMNYAQKVGLANAFGYSDATSAITYGFDFSTNCPNGLDLNAATSIGASAGLGVGANIPLAAPLGCLLSNSDNLVPLKFLPSCRIQLTTDTLGNVYNGTGTAVATTITNYSIQSCELCYDIIEFSPLVDQAISSMNAGKITIRSQSFLSSGVTIASGTSGSTEYLFNQRLASIKSLFAHLSGSDATKVNNFFDSVDITTNNGDYQFFVSGMPYPPRPLSTVVNKSGVSMELSSAFGPAHDLLTSNFSINPTEFNYTIASTTTVQQMGKFYLGVNTEKLSTNGALLTGISSQGSPISLRVSTGTALSQAAVIQLICLYDALLQIDIPSRTLVVLQ